MRLLYSHATVLKPYNILLKKLLLGNISNIEYFQGIWGNQNYSWRRFTFVGFSCTKATKFMPTYCPRLPSKSLLTKLERALSGSPGRIHLCCFSASPNFRLLQMSKRVLCKFFAHGACLKGEHCEFSHDWKDPSNNICTFYQKGVCSYGSRCRYDHVKASHQASASFSPSSLSGRASSSIQITHPSGTTSVRVSASPPTYITESVSIRPLSTIGKPVWTQETHSSPLNDNGHSYGLLDPAEKPICSFAAAGNCPRGESCPHIHGDLCPTCGKQCLHPYREEEREDHIRICQKNSKHLEALRLSQEIECCVCLERVLSKPTPAERKFGLLSECDHPFCISCIRNWRSNSPSSGMDVNTALRACPICRKLSYFVIPSVIWYSSKEDKQEIVDGYKAKLSSIDCKYFDFGNGSCPFSTSCFYRHAYRDGRLEEVVLRHLDADDGKTVIAKDIRLSDFFSRLRL